MKLYKPITENLTEQNVKDMAIECRKQNLDFSWDYRRKCLMVQIGKVKVKDNKIVPEVMI